MKKQLFLLIAVSFLFIGCHKKSMEQLATEKFNERQDKQDAERLRAKELTSIVYGMDGYEYKYTERKKALEELRTILGDDISYSLKLELDSIENVIMH